MNQISAYEVWVKDWKETASTVYATSASRARYDRWLSVIDAWQDVPFTAMRSRKIGPSAPTSDQFKRCAAYRGWPNARQGQTRVRFKSTGQTGVLVGHDAGSNFLVIFDDHPKNPCHVHPGDLEEIV